MRELMSRYPARELAGQAVILLSAGLLVFVIYQAMTHGLVPHGGAAPAVPTAAAAADDPADAPVVPTPGTLVVADAAPTAAPTVASPSAPDATPTASSDWTGSYVIKQGDTLSRLARSYGTTVNDLETQNNITDPRKLAVGQKLVVPH